MVGMELMDFPATTVDLWLIPLPEEGLTLQQLERQLSDGDYKRAMEFSRPSARSSFALTRAAARYILSRYLGLDAVAINFGKTDLGKPHVLATQNARGLRFNLTHSGQLAVLAVTAHSEVGVDIEYLGRRRNLHALIGRYFGETTSAALEQMTEAEAKPAFLRAWTQLEAFQKAIGEGLRGNYVKTEFALEPRPAGQFFGVTTDRGEASGWMSAELALPENYTGTVVAQSASSLSVNYFSLTPAELLATS